MENILEAISKINIVGLDPNSFNYTVFFNFF